MVLTLDLKMWVAGTIMAALVLLSRMISVGIPVNILRKMNREFHPHAVKILTWGGLRGGISVALALSIPAGAERDVIVAVTYVIVVLSILLQGLTIGKLVSATSQPGEVREDDGH